MLSLRRRVLQAYNTKSTIIVAEDSEDSDHSPYVQADLNFRWAYGQTFRECCGPAHIILYFIAMFCVLCHLLLYCNALGFMFFILCHV